MVAAWVLIAFAIAQRPPRIFKPRWLQEKEARAPMHMSKDWFDVIIFTSTISMSVMTLFGIIFLVVRQR